jgi:hypothetical protein
LFDEMGVKKIRLAAYWGDQGTITLGGTNPVSCLAGVDGLVETLVVNPLYRCQIGSGHLAYGCGHDQLRHNREHGVTPA